MTDVEFRRWFGSQLRAAREQRGLSRAELARMLPGSIESTALRVWETGKVYPRAANVAAILTALEVPPDAVFGDG
jgi:transcriptional regulator with XRE-family HTH domain